MSKSPKLDVPVTQRWAYALIPLSLALLLAGAVLFGAASAQDHTLAASKVHCLSITTNDFATALGGIDPATVSVGPTTGPALSDYGRKDCQMLSTLGVTIEVALWDDPTGAKFGQLQSWATSTPLWIPFVDPGVQGFCYARTMTDSMLGAVSLYTCDLRKGAKDLEVQDFDSYPPLQQGQVMDLSEGRSGENVALIDGCAGAGRGDSFGHVA